MSSLIISELHIYPVKSLAGNSLQQSRLEPLGLQHDRRWMVVDAKTGGFISQRSHPRMCLMRAELQTDGLWLDFNGQGLTVKIPSGLQHRPVIVWGDQCEAWDAGDDAASWLTRILKIDCRLVYFPENESRQVDLDYAKVGDKTAFSDGFPLLLISQASLDDLNSRLIEPVCMARFRPNIVVSGCSPFAEDDWQQLKIGNINLRVVKPCGRCSIPNINPLTGERGKEPTLTLSQYRRWDNQIFFGQNVIADDVGELTVGMTVEIIE